MRLPNQHKIKGLAIKIYNFYQETKELHEREKENKIKKGNI
jgi:hypothetical protein